MPRFFVNNFATTLSANITNVQTTLPLQAGDGALLPNIIFDSPQDQDFLLTITDGTNIEVVRCTEHNGSDTLATIERNFDGNGSFAFLSGDTVEMRVTADSLADYWLNSATAKGLTARGNFTIQLIPVRSSVDHVAAGDRSICIGGFTQTTAAQIGSIVIGDFSQIIATGSGPNIIIGRSINGWDSENSIIIGNNPSFSGTNQSRTIHIGNAGSIDGNDQVSVGYDNNVSGDGAVLLGSDLGRGATNRERNGVLIGTGWGNASAEATVANPTNLHGGLAMGQADSFGDFPIKGLARIQWPRAFGGLLDLEIPANTDKPSYSNNGTEVTLATHRILFTSATPFGSPPLTFYTFQLPSDSALGPSFMFVEEVGVVFDTETGGPASVTTDLVIDVGSSGIGSTEILAAQTVSTGVVPTPRTQERFASLIPDTGVNAITVTMDTPALYDTGTTRGWIYVRGILYSGRVAGT